MSWTEIGGIPSETSKNTRYAISVNEDGHLGCKCSSWIHSIATPKTCKHTQSDAAGKLLRAHQMRFRPVPPVLPRLGATYYDWGINEYVAHVRKSDAAAVDELLWAAKRIHALRYVTVSEIETIRKVFAKLGLAL